MKIYVDGESLSPDSFSEFDSYVKENNISFQLNTSANIEEVCNKYDLIFTSNKEIINRLINENKNIIIRTSSPISTNIIDECKKSFKFFGEKGNVYPPLKIICKLKRKSS